MKILWYSNAPFDNTGYGIQTRHVVEGLQKLGHEVAIFPNHGLEGALIDAPPHRFYPRYRDTFGSDVLASHAKHFGADLVVTLYDLWPFPIDLAAKLRVPWAPWFPVDTDPVNALTLRIAQTADFPVVYSQFAQAEMRRCGLECHYIAHGVDTDTYNVIGKEHARQELDLPLDKFIVVIVAANQGNRKSFPENLAAFARFHYQHPDSLLFIHSTAKPRTPDGVELDRIIESLGITNAVRFADEYAMMLGIPAEVMALIYNAGDVLLAGSRGEGFGVPIVEAQACGLPVITTQFSSMPELTLHGVCVPPLQMDWTFLNTWQAMPNVAGMVAALEFLYQRSRTDPVAVAKSAAHARDVIVSRYSWPVVITQWNQFLNEIQSGKQTSTTECCRHFEINGVAIDAYDDSQSFSTEAVAAELTADTYGLERVGLKAGDVVLDIGGHVGLFAIYVAKRWPGVRIYSFEPSEINHERFLRNIALNRADGISLQNLAVTADGRDVELHQERGNTGGTSCFVRPNGHSVQLSKSVRLSEIFDLFGIDRCRLLKIDAEGIEHEILTEADCLNRIDYLSGEFHINETLSSRGYSIPELYRHCRQFLPADRITYTSCSMSD